MPDEQANMMREEGEERGVRFCEMRPQEVKGQRSELFRMVKMPRAVAQQ